MKKSVLLGAVTLAMASSTAYAQVVEEVEEVYVSVNQTAQVDKWVADCSQGRLINKNKDNWFITLEGGANMLFGRGDIHADIKDRIDGTGALYVGKWVTPNFGFRFGANYTMTKGATSARYGNNFRKWNVSHPLVKGDEVQEGWYAQKWMGIGPEFDVMVNLTNWWCGYRPGRVYNAVVHGGAGAYWRWQYNQKGAPQYNAGTVYYPDSKWHAAHNTIMFATLGLQNNFRLSKHVDFFIDLQYQIIDEPVLEHDANVYLGFNFNLGKTDWNCPVVPVCADVTPLKDEINRLKGDVRNLDSKNRSLQAELDACRANANKKTTTSKNVYIDAQGNQVTVVNSSQLVTIYYPINQYDLSAREKKVLQAVADVMMANPGTSYDIVGWADNYTGTSEYNDVLREKRANGVRDYLVSLGVDPAQLNTAINVNDLSAEKYEEFNASIVEGKSAPLDRAVTIGVAQ